MKTTTPARHEEGHKESCNPSLPEDANSTEIDAQSMVDATDLTRGSGHQTRRVYGMWSGQETSNPRAELVSARRACRETHVTAGGGRLMQCVIAATGNAATVTQVPQTAETATSVTVTAVTALPRQLSRLKIKSKSRRSGLTCASREVYD